jgi:hypothetical protein
MSRASLRGILDCWRTSRKSFIFASADLRGHRTGEIVALVVGSRFARAGTKAIAAARLASAQPFAAVDLLRKHRDGTEEGASRIQADTPSSIVQAIERLDELFAAHPTVVIAVTLDEEGITLLLEHADRVVTILARDEVVTLATILRTASQDAELVLVSEEIGFPPISFDGYRVVRRCAKDLTAADVAWLGRHLSRTLRSKQCCVSNADQKPLSIRFFAKERRETDWRSLREYSERARPIVPLLISRFLRPS